MENEKKKITWENSESDFGDFLDAFGTLENDDLENKVDLTNFLLFKILKELINKSGKRIEKYKLDILDKKVIELGKEKGFVTSEEVRTYYQRWIKPKMNKLVALGYFEKPEDKLTFIQWKFKEEN